MIICYLLRTKNVDSPQKSPITTARLQLDGMVTLVLCPDPTQLMPPSSHERRRGLVTLTTATVWLCLVFLVILPIAGLFIMASFRRKALN